MYQAADNSLPAGALEANRAGVLTDEQRRSLTAYVRNTRTNGLAVAAVVVVIGVLVLTSKSFAYGPALRPVFALAAFAVAAGLVLNHLGFFSLVLRDARAGRVESVEGAISKQRWVNQKSAQTGRCYVQVAGRSFVTGYERYHAMPDAGFVRLYYLPRSRRVVNLELVPGPQLPEGALGSPATMRTLIKESLSFDSDKQAEARARLAGLISRLAPEESSGPPPQQREARPLGQAILGNWRSGGFGVSFSPDGSLTFTPPVGGEMRGQWSVDAAGRLHADLMGGAEVGDAWVAGDGLTIHAGGKRLIFHRV